MSINLQTLVRYADMSDIPARQRSTCKYVLLEIADEVRAGEEPHASPLQDIIAAKTALARRAVVRAVQVLAEFAYLSTTRTGTSSIYTINVDKLRQRQVDDGVHAHSKVISGQVSAR